MNERPDKRTGATPMRGKVILVLILTAVSVVTGSFLRSQMNGHTPFTATLVQNNFGQDGNLIMTGQKVYAVKSNGTHVIATTVQDPEGNPRMKKVLVDTETLRRVGSDETTESMTTYHLGNGAEEVFWHRATDCRGDVTSEHSTIFGYEVVKKVIEHPGMGGNGCVSATQTSYLAPALNCYPLREEYYSDYCGSEPSRLVQKSEVTGIVEGDPDEDLFEMPDYPEKKPSEAIREFEKRYHPEGSPGTPPESLSKLDEAYERSRQQ